MRYISLVTAGLLTIGATYLSADKIEFIGMDAPKTVDEMSKSYSNAKVRVYSSDKKFKEYPLSYDRLFGVKDKIGSNRFPAGALYDYKGNPIFDPYGKMVIAETPDANSLLKVNNELFLVTHYEYDWILSDGGDVEKIDNWYTRMPMSMTLTSIEQKKDGKLEAINQKPIDFSNVDGLWIPCFGSQTPWNTHLGGEEDYDLYFTAASGDKNYKKAQKGLKALDEKYFLNEKKSNPYHYGFIFEVNVKNNSNYDVAKHYAMGRGTWEMAKIMPDKRTAYFGDDGTNVGLFMFVADKEEILDSGTLYAAKWNQTSANGDKNGGTANLTWYKLGNSDSKTIKKYADTLKFNDIFDSVGKKDYKPEIHKDYKPVVAGHSEIEYLKLKSGMETAAAFLETRRYAAYVGATTEWNKMEGVTVDTKDKKLYIAMSYIDKGMRENSEFGADDIKIAKNNCGGTYELNLKSNQTAVGGEKINSDFVAVDMSIPSMLLGEEIAPDAVGNTCHVDKIANTDNIFFSDKMRTLFIGEDSGTHVNNFVWAYNVDTKKLSRLLSLPAGAESTGLQVVDDINGHAYIMSNAQHLGDYTKNTKDELKKEFNKKIDKFDAPIGYIRGIPAIK